MKENGLIEFRWHGRGGQGGVAGNHDGFDAHFTKIGKLFFNALLDDS